MDSEFDLKNHSETINLECNEILSLDNSIRFVAMCSKEGKMLDVQYREDITPLFNEKELLYSIIKSVERNKARKESEEKLGPTMYSITAYANVKRATIPAVGGGIIFVSFERNGDEFTILKKIQDQINQPKNKQIYS